MLGRLSASCFVVWLVRKAEEYIKKKTERKEGGPVMALAMSTYMKTWQSDRIPAIIIGILLTQENRNN